MFGYIAFYAIICQTQGLHTLDSFSLPFFHPPPFDK